MTLTLKRTICELEVLKKRPGGDGEEMRELQKRILRIDITLEAVGWRRP